MIYSLKLYLEARYSSRPACSMGLQAVCRTSSIVFRPIAQIVITWIFKHFTWTQYTQTIETIFCYELDDCTVHIIHVLISEPSEAAHHKHCTAVSSYSVVLYFER